MRFQDDPLNLFIVRVEVGDEPALLIGMDIIGLIDQLVIDYRRRELQIRTRRSAG